MLRAPGQDGQGTAGHPPCPGIVAIGTSLGGLNALRTLLSHLPPTLAVPVVVVQHRGRNTGGGGDDMAAALGRHTPLKVVDAEDKGSLLPGRVYLAPADYHLLVERGQVALSTDGRVNFARPSIDVLLESAADAYGGGAIAIVLTGASRDGAAGAAAVATRGGIVLVQDPLTAEGRTLPAAAIEAANVPRERVLPLGEIAGYVAGLCRGMKGTGGDDGRGDAVAAAAARSPT
jgi:two-component system chemotaxis response regulator CheB